MPESIADALKKIDELRAFVEEQQKRIEESKKTTRDVIKPGAAFVFGNSKDRHYLICDVSEKKWWLAGVRGNPFHLYHVPNEKGHRTFDEMCAYMEKYTFVEFYEAKNEK